MRGWLWLSMWALDALAACSDDVALGTLREPKPVVADRHSGGGGSDGAGVVDASADGSSVGSGYGPRAGDAADGTGGAGVGDAGSGAVSGGSAEPDDVDADAGGALPCELADSECLACEDDIDCADNLLRPVCDTTSSTCVECPVADQQLALQLRVVSCLTLPAVACIPLARVEAAACFKSVCGNYCEAR